METLNDFGWAIQQIKQGKAVARFGWNGKGMYVYLNKGSVDAAGKYTSLSISGVSFDLFDIGDSGTLTRLPNLVMKTAGGEILNGWLASQTDILAEDWVLA